jgi:hypothetical protein
MLRWVAFRQAPRRGRLEKPFVLPWAEMWRAMISLGIAPSEFWSLSYKEWRWLLETQTDSLKPDQLMDLMKEYPDG